MVRTKVAWSRCTVSIDGVTYRKVRFVADADTGEARIFDASGSLLAMTVGPTTVEIGRTAASVTTGEGSSWSVTKDRGCGCGG